MIKQTVAIVLVCIQSILSHSVDKLHRYMYERKYRNHTSKTNRITRPLTKTHHIAWCWIGSSRATASWESYRFWDHCYRCEYAKIILAEKKKNLNIFSHTEIFLFGFLYPQKKGATEKISSIISDKKETEIISSKLLCIFVCRFYFLVTKKEKKVPIKQNIFQRR